MMNIQQYQNYFPYVNEAQVQFQGEIEQAKQNQGSNYNEFNLFQQNFYASTFPPYQFEFVQEHEIPSQIKNKKNKKHKNNDQKGLLPKTLESDKQFIEDQQQIIIPQDQIIKQPYPVFHYTKGNPMPKLQSDIVSNPHQDGQGSQEGSQQTQKQKGQHSQIKKPKKENINTGHWSTDEHSTYISFLQQYEDIMTSSMMKKTSKIFKQMSELIGTRTPSQCRSHHQKFNPYALRGENGKRLPRAERSRAGRKKKNPQTDLPKAEEANIIANYETHDPYYQYMMLEQQKFYYSNLQQEFWNPQHEMEHHPNIKKEEEIEFMNNPHIQQLQQEYEECLKYNIPYIQRNGIQSDYNFDARNQAINDLLI
ncbi:unnamed protein product [Paramecium primaurelia]|uniref:Myb-like domain-containing protein n=1 Tax=Paramecium primaurelia TaxID=5886 RepID=A0A8S1MNJ4_PARPR|nr:unnamed protein product [Paramecium primaurelia]